MAWNNLIDHIKSIIKSNGNQEITGETLRGVLNAVVTKDGNNMLFAGIATPTTSPGAPDGPVFYLAKTQGVYPNFDNVSITTNTLHVIAWHDVARKWEAYSLEVPIGSGNNNNNSTTYDDRELISSIGLINAMSVFDLNSDDTQTLKQVIQGLAKKYPAKSGEDFSLCRKPGIIVTFQEIYAFKPEQGEHSKIAIRQALYQYNGKDVSDEEFTKESNWEDVSFVRLLNEIAQEIQDRQNEDSTLRQMITTTRGAYLTIEVSSFKMLMSTLTTIIASETLGVARAVIINNVEIGTIKLFRGYLDTIIAILETTYDINNNELFDYGDSSALKTYRTFRSSGIWSNWKLVNTLELN